MSCPCLTINPTLRDGLIYCEYCFFEGFPTECFETEDGCLVIIDDIIELEDLRPPYVASSQHLYQCMVCSSTSFYLNFQCDCQRSIACERCFKDVITNNKRCSFCNTQPQWLDRLAYHDFRRHMQISCSFCQTLVILGDLNLHIRKKCPSSIGDCDLRKFQLRWFKNHQFARKLQAENVFYDDLQAQISNDPTLL
jgi:hypothetical protein